MNKLTKITRINKATRDAMNEAGNDLTPGELKKRFFFIIFLMAALFTIIDLLIQAK